MAFWPGRSTMMVAAILVRSRFSSHSSIKHRDGMRYFLGRLTQHTFADQFRCQEALGAGR